MDGTSYVRGQRLDINCQEAENAPVWIRQIVDDVPHYVANEEVCKLSMSDDVRKTVKAMLKAGIQEIPFDPILIEFDSVVSGSRARCFVRIQRRPLLPLYKSYNDQENVAFYAYPIILVSGFKHYELLLVMFAPDMPAEISYRDHDFTIRQRDKTPNLEPLYYAAVQGFLIGQLMLNTRGIEKEHICTAKLDKIHAKKGRPKIGGYSVLKIGTVYDKSGKGHDRQSTGRHMPVHYRAGHVRQQPFGPGRKKVRPIFIAPCLVNYAPDGPKPRIPQHEVTI
jgi:hypothetical protein